MRFEESWALGRLLWKFELALEEILLPAAILEAMPEPAAPVPAKDFV